MDRGNSEPAASWDLWWLVFWLAAAIAALVLHLPALVLPFAFFAGERWVMWRPTVVGWLEERRR